MIVTLKRSTLKAALPRRRRTAGRATGTITSFVESSCRIIVARDGKPRINVVRATVSRFYEVCPRCATAPATIYSTVDRKCVKCSLRGTVHARLLNEKVCGAISAVLARIIISPCSRTFCRPAGVVNHIVARTRTRRRRGGNGRIARIRKNCEEIITTPGPISVIRGSTVGTLISTSRIIVTYNNNKVPILTRSGGLRNTDTIVRGSLTTKGLTSALSTSELIVLADISGIYLGCNGRSRGPLSAVAISRTGGCLTTKRFSRNAVTPGVRTTVSFVNSSTVHSILVAGLGGRNGAISNNVNALVAG